MAHPNNYVVTFCIAKWQVEIKSSKDGYCAALDILEKLIIFVIFNWDKQIQSHANYAVGRMPPLFMHKSLADQWSKRIT